LTNKSNKKLVIRNVYYIDDKKRKEDELKDSIRKKLTTEELRYINGNIKSI